MGNALSSSNVKAIGDTQQSIGEVSATISKVTGTIFGSIMIIIGIILCIVAFIPISDTSTNIQDCKEDADCVNKKCNKSVGKCYNSSTPTTKVKHYYFIIIGVIVMIIGGLIIWWVNWWSAYAHSNRTAAQIGAVGMEANLLHNIF